MGKLTARGSSDVCDGSDDRLLWYRLASNPVGAEKAIPDPTEPGEKELRLPLLPSLKHFRGMTIPVAVSDVILTLSKVPKPATIAEFDKIIFLKVFKSNYKNYQIKQNYFKFFTYYTSKKLFIFHEIEK